MKKKRILSLILAVMMVFLVFTEHTPYSFAEGSSGPVEYKPSNISSGKIEVKFKTSKGLVTTIEPKVGVVKEEHDGSAYPSFDVKIDLSELSSGDKRIKAGDSFRLPMPLNLELREETFANSTKPFFLEDKGNDAKYAVVTSDIKKDLSDKIIQNDLVIKFQDDDSEGFIVSEKKNIILSFYFEATASIPQNGEVEFEFEPALGIPKLKISAERYIIFTDHLLGKRVGGVSSSTDGENTFYYFSLFANRKNETLSYPEIIIHDEIKNKVPTEQGKNFNFDRIGFDESSFVIEKGDVDTDKENELTGTIIKFLTKGGTFTDEGDNKKISFDSGNLELILHGTENHKTFELKIQNPGKQGYKVTYAIRVPSEEVGSKYVIANTYDLKKDSTTDIDLGYTSEHKKPEVNRTLSYLAGGSITANSRGKIKVTKTDADSSKPISNVEFKLYKDGIEDNKKSTNDQGIVMFDDLELGKDEDNPIKYQVKEVSAPEDYDTSNLFISEIINLHKKGNGTSRKVAAELEATNIRKKIDIKVNKIWAGEGAEKQDVTFTLKRHVELGIPTEFNQTGVEVSKTLTVASGSDSVTFTGLHEYDGKGNKYIYTVTEEPIDGYTSKVGELKPLEGNPTLYEVTVTNTKKPVAPAVKGKFKIKKVDNATGNALAGAQFRIVKKGSDVVVEKTAATELDGTVTVELEIGEYIVKEVVAPTGYKLNDEEKTVKLENTASVPEIEFKNDKESAGGIGGITPPPPTPPAPSEDSKPEEPKQDPPKKEEPKKEEPKPQPPKEEPQPPADGIGGTGEPTPPTPTDDPIEGLTGGGAGGGTNDTNVLPGMIPGLSGGGSTAGGPNSAVDPGYVGRLPKTGEGLNSSAYALFFGLVGMSFVIYGAYKRRAKKQ